MVPKSNGVENICNWLNYLTLICLYDARKKWLKFYGDHVITPTKIIVKVWGYTWIFSITLNIQKKVIGVTALIGLGDSCALNVHIMVVHRKFILFLSLYFSFLVRALIFSPFTINTIVLRVPRNCSQRNRTSSGGLGEIPFHLCVFPSFLHLCVFHD